jgi:hypothetical protein
MDQYVKRDAWEPAVPTGPNGELLEWYFDPAEPGTGELQGPPPVLLLMYYRQFIQEEPRYGIRWASSGENTEMWHVCRMCSWEFPQSQMIKYKGEWYCIPRKHAQIVVDDDRRNRG